MPSQGLQNLGRTRTLHGQLAEFLAAEQNLGARLCVVPDPLKILLLVGRVDTEEEMTAPHAVDENVVDERPFGRHQGGVVALADCKPPDVVARDFLDRLLGGRTLQFDLTHVADVEYSRAGANRQVFRHGPGVLHRHVPPGEVHHARAQLTMNRVQRRFLEFRRVHWRVPFEKTRNRVESITSRLWESSAFPAC